jgi:hypothetical protein
MFENISSTRLPLSINFQELFFNRACNTSFMGVLLLYICFVIGCHKFEEMDGTEDIS